MSQLERLKLRLMGNDVPTDAELAVALEDAQAIIMSRRFPFGNYPVDDAGDPIMPVQFKDIQIRIAVELINRVGSEGEVMRSENGVTQTFSSGLVSTDLLREIVPVVGSFK